MAISGGWESNAHYTFAVTELLEALGKDTPARDLVYFFLQHHAVFATAERLALIIATTVEAASDAYWIAYAARQTLRRLSFASSKTSASGLLCLSRSCSFNNSIFKRFVIGTGQHCLFLFLPLYAVSR